MSQPDENNPRIDQMEHEIEFLSRVLLSTGSDLGNMRQNVDMLMSAHSTSGEKTKALERQIMAMESKITLVAGAIEDLRAVRNQDTDALYAIVTETTKFRSSINFVRALTIIWMWFIFAWIGMGWMR
jgi:chromosome segregation ATPase